MFQQYGHDEHDIDPSSPNKCVTGVNIGFAPKLGPNTITMGGDSSFVVDGEAFAPSDSDSDSTSRNYNYSMQLSATRLRVAGEIHWFTWGSSFIKQSGFTVINDHIIGGGYHASGC